MKVLVFSDLHANKKSLKDISGLINEVDLSIFCGDVLGYGRDINQCIKFVSKNVDLAVLGNHDRFSTTNENLDNQPQVVKDSILFTRSILSKKQIEFISSLPKEIWYKDFYITHSLGDKYLRNRSDFLKLYKKLHKNTKYGFFGHTHEQVLFKYKNKIIINPGSITKGRKGFDRSYVIIENNSIEFINLEKIL